MVKSLIGDGKKAFFPGYERVLKKEFLYLSLDLSLFGRAESQSAFIGVLVARETFFLSVYERVEARESLDELKVTESHSSTVELSRAYLIESLFLSIDELKNGSFFLFIEEF